MGILKQTVYKSGKCRRIFGLKYIHPHVRTRLQLIILLQAAMQHTNNPVMYSHRYRYSLLNISNLHCAHRLYVSVVKILITRSDCFP